MNLHNYNETVVKEVLDELLKKDDTICDCEKCRLDIQAIALNNLPPQYYVSEQGEVYTKLSSTYLDTRIKVLTELTKALLIVQKQPLHE